MAADRLAEITAPARSLVEAGRPDELILMPGQVSRLIASWLREKAGIGGRDRTRRACDAGPPGVEDRGGHQTARASLVKQAFAR